MKSVLQHEEDSCVMKPGYIHSAHIQPCAILDSWGRKIWKFAEICGQLSQAMLHFCGRKKDL